MDFATAKRKLKKAFANAKYLPQSRVRTCRCCNRLSLIVSFSADEETKRCLRCRANLRYEMLAEDVRELRDFPHLDVLELDRHSPLRSLLAGSKSYRRSFFSFSEPLGSLHPDGAYCEDITKLTLPSESLDLIVSSDVLEHVPDLVATFRESARVLRPGGCHLFTTPTGKSTIQRAEIVDGEVHHILEPEYHSDPLNPMGILAFWNFGLDAPSIFNTPDLELSIISGPEGSGGGWHVWRALRLG